MQMLGDRHTWDARVSLPVREEGASASASFRTLAAGRVNVLATSLAHAGAGPFEGAIAVLIRRPDGSLVREFVLGRGGTGHTQAGVSSWTTLGQIDVPRLWLRGWELETRVLSADPAFAAKQIDIMLRKERRELGMGGMVFYVTIFIGLLLLVVATLLALAWRPTLGHVPWIVSTATLLLIVVLVF